MNTFHPDDFKKYRAIPWTLTHIALNNFFYIWTFGGSVFLLFLSELGLPKDQIGVLLSFFPFAGLLALGFSSLVAQWGRKRVYLLGYGIRKPVMGLLLCLPWLMAHAGRETALIFLYAIILTVAVLRAIAETAYFPWLQEFVPNSVRGRYGALSSVISIATSLLALFIASRVIEHGEGLERYLFLIAAGVVIGLVGVAAMGMTPGGAPIPKAEAAPAFSVHLLETLQDRNYLYFLGGMGCYTLSAYMLGGFLPLYVKEQLGLAPSVVVLFDMAGMVGSALASVCAGILADRVGSRPVMMPGLALSVLIPLGWLMNRANPAPAAGVSLFTDQAALASAFLYFAYGAAASSASLGASRLLFNGVIPFEKNTAYTAIYYAWAGLTGGIGPLLAGRLLSSLSGWQVSAGFFTLDAFRLLFLVSLFGFVGGVILYGKVRPDGEYSTRSAIRQLFARGRQAS